MSLRGLCRALVVVAFSASPGHAVSAALPAQLTPAVVQPQALVQEGSSTAVFSGALSFDAMSFRGALSFEAGYPLPVVHHEKDPASGYSEGSPLYEAQRRWVERNGDNSISSSGGEFEWVPGLWRPVWEQFYYHPVRSVCVLLFQILVLVLFAWLYLQYMPIWRKNRTDLAFHQPNESSSFTDWRHSPCDINCANDWQLCLWGCCCPIARWADNIGQERELKGVLFWIAFALMLILNILGPITLGISLVIALCIAIYFRQKMRRTNNLSPGEPWTLLYDILLWCCCPGCALMQEARQVEKQIAIQAYYDAEGFSPDLLRTCAFEARQFYDA